MFGLGVAELQIIFCITVPVVFVVFVIRVMQRRR